MTTHIALLRGINLAGHRKVAMADLRELAAGLGLEDAKTLLQSGNLIFRSAKRKPDQLERVLETEVQKALDLRTDCFVRTASEWQEIIAGNPFPAEAKHAPGHLAVMLFKSAPAASDVKVLQSAITGPELVRVAGTHAYIVYPDGVGRSRLTSALLDGKLRTRGTGRNWNTVLKLGALAAP